MCAHVFKESILKQYDIRGVVGRDLGELDAYYVGKSYGTLLRQLSKRSCVVGHDVRRTSRLYSDRAIEGLVECGLEVVDIGLAPTPMVYFAIQELHQDAGLIVTASHNPPEYNGFKMLTSEDPIWGADIKKLGVIAKNGDFFRSSEPGRAMATTVREKYLEFLLNTLARNPKKKLKICWDPGNAAVAVILDDFLEKLPNENITICGEIDPSFPNHHPNPEEPENMKMLSEAVVANGCDLGIAFDGDGDRIGVVDGEGSLLYGDQLLCIFARDYLKRNPGRKVMSEVSSSLVLYDDIARHGGVPVMWKPGHSIQKAKMKSDGIGLAGETSGHIFFGENHNYDDALYAAVKLMNILADAGETIGEMRRGFPETFSTKKITIKSNDTDKFAVPEEIARRLRGQAREICSVEGVRVNRADGWWLCRNSSTGPNMTVRCEALSPEGLGECKAELREQLALSGYEINFDSTPD
ncbi:MAG: phosphomannomutase/phosphoglucomutase [Rickettsiales bacterium]|jgi:phosphomannomutase|nr:phosphomannomutase/phosphoglucomutase [Rickettsiales bacterium]